MTEIRKSNPVGINHISLEVGNVAEAIAFYGSFLHLDVIHEDVGPHPIPGEELASIEMGDQFIALTLGDTRAVDKDRHIGLVVDDKDLVRANLERLGIPLLPGSTLGFIDPWGNRIEIVTYSKILFDKPGTVLRAMGLGDLKKNPDTIERLKKNKYITA